MPTFSRSLEKALHRALAFANERHHEFATLEHLLLSLIEDKDAVAVMRACNVNVDELRNSLTNYVDTELANLISDDVLEIKTHRRLPARDPACGHPCAVLWPRRSDGR